MDSNFASEEAKKSSDQEQQAKDLLEEERKSLLKTTIAILNEEFKNTSTELYLVGSVTRPYAFKPTSDIDIVLKNFSGDHLDLKTKLEKKLGREVELFTYNGSPLQD